METLVASPVQVAERHALPFRVFLEEFRLRREPELLAAARVALIDLPDDANDDAVGVAILAAVTEQEQAYKDLEDALLPATVADQPGDLIRQYLRSCDMKDRPLKHILHLMDASALCLSGGGIRSASFGLGVLEGLAVFSRSAESDASVLDNLDYLSTVSGGGYIGSWLSSWVTRRETAGDAAGETSIFESVALTKRKAKLSTPWGEVITAMANRPPSTENAPSEPVTGGDPEPQPVRHLRNYTSFLAPSLGITLDTFTLVAIIFRNLLINWTMLVPLLFAFIAGVRTSGMFFGAVHHTQKNPDTANLVLIVCTGLFLIAALAAAFSLPSHFSVLKLRNLRRPLLYVFFSAVISASWLLASSETPAPGWHMWPLNEPFAVRTGIAFLGYATLAISIWLAHNARMRELQEQARIVNITQRGSAPRPAKLRWRSSSTVLVMCLLGAVAASFVASSLLLLVQRSLFPLFPHHIHLQLLLAFPSILTVVMASTSLFCALLGVYEKEEDREWWVRGGGAFLALNLFWIFIHAAVFYGSPAWSRIIGAAGVALAGIVSMLGASSGVPAAASTAKVAQVTKVGKFLMKHNLILPALALIAIAMIVLGNVAAEENIRLHLLSKAGLTDSTIWAFLFFLSCTAVAVGINFAININLFSLQGMYRMRLMRAFLGASNGKRHPDPFTNFDPRDTPLMTELPSKPGAPLHIINTTLNLVGTRDTAWRQRRAESFTFSAVHSGGWRVGYVPAPNYGGPGGTTLATAMAISGAAFNPNMGYQSSPILALLMTFFCVRLGVWLPNPARPTTKWPLGATYQDFFSKGGPSFALLPLVAEAFGLTNDTYRWIELTDGGHFENLALYEMIMRRCRNIIVVDAGADPNCQFEDLGNAIRKIHIDLGIPIRLKEDLKMRAGMKHKNKYCVVGEIDYSCVDTPPPGRTCADIKGTLVYIKAGMNGTEPADILQYAYTHPTFPHETTTNQFYNESQFESYRHLGNWVIEKIAGRAPAAVDGVADLSIETFTKAADDFWKVPSRPPEVKDSVHQERMAD